MLNSKFSMAVFLGHLLLFIVFPFTSYQHPQSNNSAMDDANNYASANFSNKVQLNRRAVKFVRNYIKRNNDELVEIKERSQTPFRTMDQVFAKYGLPLQLKYLAVIESELKPSAVSRVGAVGPWQLMPATAKILGLKISRSVDDRKQYAKSTKAAALYLRDLYSEFGDWLLVIAAYNCGPGPVHIAINESGSHNFWALQNHLPKESSDHVKKFIATHYFFEGNGSVTTLTKAENIKYNKIQLSLTSKQRGPAAAKQKAVAKDALAEFKHSVVFGY